MLEVKNIFPSSGETIEHIFDFAEEGTVGRAIFEDNIELLQQLLAIQHDEGKEQIFEKVRQNITAEGIYLIVCI